MDKPGMLRAARSLHDLLHVPCDCDEAWTGRGRHSVDCLYQFVHDFLTDEEITAIESALAPIYGMPRPEWDAYGVREPFTPDYTMDDVQEDVRDPWDEPDPVQCAICGDYSAGGVEVHELCLFPTIEWWPPHG